MNTSAPPRRPNRLAPDPDTSARSTTKGDVPQALLDRYLIERDRQGRPERFFRDHRAEAPVIRDGGRRLWAASDYPDAVADLVRIARHRGWTRVKVDGAESFRREVWIQARREGLDVAGYRPKERDRRAAGEPLASSSRARSDIEDRLRKASIVLRSILPDPVARARLLAAAWSRAEDRSPARDRANEKDRFLRR